MQFWPYILHVKIVCPLTKRWAQGTPGFLNLDALAETGDPLMASRWEARTSPGTAEASLPARRPAWPESNQWADDFIKGFYCSREHTHAKINMQDWSVFSQHLLSAGDCFHQIAAKVYLSIYTDRYAFHSSYLLHAI